MIQTSSIAANIFGHKFHINDIQNERDYTPVKAYGATKLCNILFTHELHRRYSAHGISSVAFEPGVSRSNFASEASWFFKTAYHTPLKYLFTISTEKSAKRLVHLALGVPGYDFLCGETYSNKKPFRVKFKDNGRIAEELWKQCEQMTAQCKL